MRELVIDNFAGGGGASTGIEWALGQPVDIAINHDRESVMMHWANHPTTAHFCEDVWSIDPVKVCAGRPVGLAWFSPDCTHFSKAKGGQPVKKKIRGLAWVVLRWAGLVRPRVIMLENVEEFRTWGPVRKGKPIKKFKGVTFEKWKSQLRDLGYKIDHRELVAADYGAKTSRKRLFLIARCDGEPIVWPEKTHGPGRSLPWGTASECIDWTIPCPSIFERKKPLAENTLKRIARGIQKFVIDAKEPFIVCCNHSGDGFRGQSIAEPLKTITAARDAVGLVSPCLSKYHGLKANESRCGQVEEPFKTIDTSNRYSLVEAFLAKFRGQSPGNSALEPMATITGGAGSKRPAGAAHALGVISTHLSKMYGTAIGSDIRKPMPTITGGGQHIAEVRAFLLKYYGNEKHGCSLAEPMDTVTGKDRIGLVTIHGVDYRIVDIGLRMLTPRELARGQGFPESYILTGTKSSQVARIGNSVSPHNAKAIVKANVKLRDVRMEASA
jgi:DNA (cytosine-5)-methyltransferase 1